MDDEVPAVWVTTEWTAAGAKDGYVATVHATKDRSFSLGRAQALAYASTVFQICAVAEYEAAMFAQFKATGMDDETRVEAVFQFRDKRPDLHPEWTAPMLFIPGVSMRTGNPFLHVKLGTIDVTQWSPTEARGHASHVLDSAFVAELDNIYLGFCQHTIGLDRQRAMGIVNDLIHYRSEDGEDDTLTQWPDESA